MIIYKNPNLIEDIFEDTVIIQLNNRIYILNQTAYQLLELCDHYEKNNILTEYIKKFYSSKYNKDEIINECNEMLQSMIKEQIILVEQ